MPMYYTPEKFAVDAVYASGSLFLYEDKGISDKNVQEGLNRGITFCQAIERYLIAKSEENFIGGELPMLKYIHSLSQYHPKFEEHFEQSSSVRKRLEDLVNPEKIITPETQEKVKNYFKFFAINLVYING